MKTLAIAVTLLIATSAHADVLKCWNMYSKVRVPLISAQIVSNTELKHLSVNPKAYDQGFEENLQATDESATGKLITTKRSPYVGMQNFMLSDFRLVLPADLSSEGLQAAGKKGYRGENGVAIGSWDAGGDGAGDHISVRLRCRSYSK